MTPEELYNKACKIGRLSFKEEEIIISQHSYYSYVYALNVLNLSFPLGEKAISKDAYYSYFYARDILYKRFLLGENVISQDNNLIKPYCKYFNISEKDLVITQKDMINKYYKK